MNDNSIEIGIEPVYKNDELQIIRFSSKNKDSCCIKTGIARGCYGSNIQGRIKFYNEYKRQCQFKGFIDRWYDRLKLYTDKVGRVRKKIEKLENKKRSRHE